MKSKKIEKIIFTSLLLALPVDVFAGATFTQTSAALTNLQTIIAGLIKIMFGLAIVAFFWGVAKFILQAGNPKAREQGKNIMIWGVIAIFIMASIWGIVALISSTLGTTGTSTGGSSGTSGCTNIGAFAVNCG